MVAFTVGVCANILIVAVYSTFRFLSRNSRRLPDANLCSYFFTMSTARKNKTARQNFQPVNFEERTIDLILIFYNYVESAFTNFSRLKW